MKEGVETEQEWDVTPELCITVLPLGCEFCRSRTLIYVQACSHYHSKDSIQRLMAVGLNAVFYRQLLFFGVVQNGTNISLNVYVVQRILNTCAIMCSCQFYPEVVKSGESVKGWICGHLACWQERSGRTVTSFVFCLEAAVKLEWNLNVEIWEMGPSVDFLVGIYGKFHLRGTFNIHVSAIWRLSEVG